jgi:hypothetical protein
MRPDRIEYPIEEIRGLIAAGWTQQKIADELARKVDPRINAKLIYKVCKKHGIECQRTGPRAGEGHPEWRGGRIRDKSGYIHVWAPDHPECQRVNEARRVKADGKYYRKEKYIQEHRLVMEAHLGRYLLPTEVVHHKNDDPTDNRLENLELFDSNAKHLATTLAGQCPKWTLLGLARIRASAILKGFPEARKCSFLQLANLLLSIQTELELDVPPSKIEFVHWLTKNGLTAEQAFERASQLAPPQIAA